jgi:hypothetical protein
MEVKMEVTFDSSIKTTGYEIPREPEPLTIEDYIINPDEVEFAPSTDDCPAIIEFRNEVEEYDQYKIKPKSGCGGFLDCFG